MQRRLKWLADQRRWRRRCSDFGDRFATARASCKNPQLRFCHLDKPRTYAQYLSLQESTMQSLATSKAATGVPSKLNAPRHLSSGQQLWAAMAEERRAGF